MLFSKIKVAQHKQLGITICSIYDAKPLYFLDTIHNNLEITVTKTMKIWDINTSSCKFVEKTKLNAVDDYNHGMNGVDISD